jgi:hypothetical protein
LLNEARKAVAALIGVVVGWSGLVVHSAPHHITSTEWQVLGAGLAGVALTYLVPNDPPPWNPPERPSD